MVRIILSALLSALAVPFFVKWIRGEVENQLDKMQEAVFNTPGAEAPVPPTVILGGAGLLAGHFVTARLLGLRFWQAFVSLVLAVGAGIGLYVFGVAVQRK